MQTIISVDEVSQKRGCIYVVPSSHGLGDLKAKRYAEGQIEDKIDVRTAIPCLTQPGDVLILPRTLSTDPSPIRATGHGARI